MSTRVFITYAHEDGNFVDRLASELDKYPGLEVAIDKRVMKKEDSLLSLLGAIEESKFHLAVLSSSSAPSRWCKKELKVGAVKEIEEAGFQLVGIVPPGEKWDTVKELLTPEIRGAFRDKLLVRFDTLAFPTALAAVVERLGQDAERANTIYAQVEGADSQNPFRRIRAEHFDDPAVFASMFTEPAQAYQRIVSPQPTLIEGSRGSGKTMILKSLMAHWAVARTSEHRFRVSGLRHFGVYCRMTRDALAIGSVAETDPDGTRAAQRIVYTELVLRLVQALAEEVRACKELDVISVSHQEEKVVAEKVAAELNLEKGRATDLEALAGLIKEQVFHVVDYVGRRDLGERPSFVGRFQTRASLEASCKTFFAGIADLRGSRLFFLIDEYENLADYQKVVLNTFIKFHTAEVVTYKVGVKKAGFTTSQTTEGQELEEGPDYAKEALDFPILDQKTGEFSRYQDYIRAICRQLLTAEGFKEKDIAKVLEERTLADDNLDEKAIALHIAKMVQDRGRRWESLGPDEQKVQLDHYEVAAFYRLLQGKRRHFGGVEELALVSSGVVRTFIELCGIAYHFATQDKVDVRNGGKIGVNHQTKAAYLLSDYYLFKIGKNVEEIGPALRGFVTDLGDVFRSRLLNHSSEPEAARLAVADPLQLDSTRVSVQLETGPLTITLKQVLDTAVEHSVLHEYELHGGGRRPKHSGDEATTDYCLNRIFAPSLGFSPRARWRTPVKSDELKGLLTGASRRKTKQRLIEATKSSGKASTRLDLGVEMP